MNYSHLLDPERTGTAVEEPPKGGKVSVVARWVDDAGKSRKKSFKKASGYEAREAAARFMLREGYILRAPQPEEPIEYAGHALRWMTAIHEPYPHGFPLAIQPNREAIWIGGTGAIIRIAPGTCDRKDVPVGDGVMVMSVGCSARGDVFAVLDIDEGSGPLGEPPWRAPGRGPHSWGLVRVVDGSLEPVANVPHTGQSDITSDVSVADDGTFLGPHADGAALYRPDGTVVRTLAARRTKHNYPAVALSRNGRWAAMTDDGGAIRRFDLVEDTVATLGDGFSQVTRLEANDDGTVLAAGIIEFWGVYRLAVDAEPLRLFESLGGVLEADGQTNLEAFSDQLVRRPALPTVDGLAEVRDWAVMPPLCGAKRSTVYWFDDTHVLVATDSHTLGCVDVTKLEAQD